MANDLDSQASHSDDEATGQLNTGEDSDGGGKFDDFDQDKDFIEEAEKLV